MEISNIHEQIERQGQLFNERIDQHAARLNNLCNDVEKLIMLIKQRGRRKA